MIFSRPQLTCRRILAVVLLHLAMAQFAIAQAPPSPTQKAKTRRIPAQDIQMVQPKQDAKRSRAVLTDLQNHVATTPAQTNRIVLRAGRLEAQISDVVSFEIQHSFSQRSAQYQFSVDYGDGPPDILSFENPKTSHMFRSKGTFKVVATVVVVSNAMLKMRFSPIRDSVYIKVDSVSLKVFPEVADVGEEVRMDVPVDTVARGRVYRFYYWNNDSVSQWSLSPEYRHSYPQAGSYQVYAEIGIQSKRGDVPITRTRVVEIDVRDTTHKQIEAKPTATNRTSPSGRDPTKVDITDPQPVVQRSVPQWLWIVAGIVLTAAIGFSVRPIREWILGPRVTMVVKPDVRGVPVKSLNPATIDIRVVLRSRLRQGRFEVTSKENSLTKSIRRKHA